MIRPIEKSHYNEKISSAGNRNSRYPLRQRRTPDYRKDYTTGEELSDLNVDSYKIMAIPQTYTEDINYY